MRKLTLFILDVVISISGFAQTISVNSFKLLDTDLTANTAGTMEIDQNGETAALIKVVTTQIGFTFDGGALGIVKTKQTPGEVWVYIPKGSKKISIKHPQLGVLRDYYFPIAIEAARTYEMVLVTGEVKTIIKQDLGAQYLVMTIEPANALVHIDDKEIAPNNGVISKLFDYGKHSYTISAPLYHTEAGVFEISSNKCEMNIKLKPNYGIVAISTTPEEGASVFLDNDIEPIGITPMNTRKLSQGEHSFKVQKNGFLSQVEKYNVIGDGSTQQLSISMKPNFGILKATIPNGCGLYVDEKAIDLRGWNGRLEEGIHKIEARRPSHRSTPMRIEIIAGKTLSVELTEPTPITGSLNINSEPINAKIIIDGKDYGKTPMIINNLLIGEHDIELQLGGYNKIKRTITIEEGETTNHVSNLTKEDDNYICIFRRDDAESGAGYASKYPVYYEGKKTARISIWVSGLKDRDLTFDFGGMKIVNNNFDGTLYHFSVLEGTKRIRITHHKLGLICNYEFEIPIESGRDYYLGVQKPSQEMIFEKEIKELLSEIPASQRKIEEENGYSCGVFIQKIERTSQHTVINMTYFSSFENWISILPETYIKSSTGEMKYKLLYAKGIALTPDKTDIADLSIKEFSLVFPAIPDDIKEIELVEPGSSWQFYNIQLKTE